MKWYELISNWNFSSQRRKEASEIIPRYDFFDISDFTLVMYLISEESPLAWSHFGNISRVCQRPPTQGAGVDLNLTRPSSYCGHYVYAAVVAPSGCSSPTLDRLYTPTTWYGTEPSMYTINYDANPQYPLQQRSLKCKNLHSQVLTIIPASTNQCACRIPTGKSFYH